MATLPMSQPTNPNQTGGASMSPSTPTLNAGVLGATVPGAGQVHNNVMMAGPGANTAGQPFGTVPVSPTNATGFKAPSITDGLNMNDGEKTLMGDMKDTYGEGSGKAIMGAIGNLGTATNTAVTSTNDAVLAAAERQKANQKAQEAARGVSPDSSSSALYASDFDAQVNSTLQSLDSSMELQGQNTLIQTLLGEGQAHGADESGWDVFGDVLNAGAGIVGTAVGAATGLSSIGGSLKSLGLGSKTGGGTIPGLSATRG